MQALGKIAVLNLLADNISLVYVSVQALSSCHEWFPAGHACASPVAAAVSSTVPVSGLGTALHPAALLCAGSARSGQALVKVANIGKNIMQLAERVKLTFLSVCWTSWMAQIPASVAPVTTSRARLPLDAGIAI